MPADLIAAGALIVVSGLLVFVGYSYGARAKAQAVKYEQILQQLYLNAYDRVNAKLASIKIEVEKIEAEAKAEEQAVVARLKKFF